jgi:hypothetical protein
MSKTNQKVVPVARPQVSGTPTGESGSNEVIRGDIIKNVDGVTSCKTDPSVNNSTVFLCVGTDVVLQKWQDEHVEYIQRTPGVFLSALRQELNAKIPQDQWEIGLDGKQREPWEFAWLAYLVRVTDGAPFTFINSTKGCMRCIKAIESRTQNMTLLKGRHVAPIGKLVGITMPTKHGTKQRPHFEITGWHKIGPDPVAVAAPTTPRISGPQRPVVDLDKDFGETLPVEIYEDDYEAA